MKKIIKLHWNNYKNSDSGKEAIADFDKLTDPNSSMEELLQLAYKYDHECFKNSNKIEKDQEIQFLNYLNTQIQNICSEIDELKQEDVHIDYKALSCIFFCDNEEMGFEDIPQAKFKSVLATNMMLSIVLSRYFPEYYIPNFFPMQFIYLEKIAEKYEIELPNMPNRSDYRGRWLYYDEMCKSINEFAIENDIQSLSELCAFFYGYEMEVIKEEMEDEYSKPMPDVPEQAWILVGNYGEGEKTMKSGFWQSNQLTCKGDIMLFYEKSPVKKLNAVWTALEDGFIDPFGPYYSYSIIGNKIEIPDDKAITYQDFKNSDYFKVENRGKEGNFVSKNFQDISGWSVTSADYSEIKRMLKAKGFDTSVLPSLYEPKKLAGIEINLEKDVSWKLLVPLLEEMGWKYKEDFFDEVEFPAGRGTTGHAMAKRSDFCLHMTGTGKGLGAKVVIEAKLNMKNNEEISENFEQGVSYAKWGNAQVLVLCDKNQIRVYERNKKGEFDENKWKRFRWEEMENLEKFNELKRMLNI